MLQCCFEEGGGQFIERYQQAVRYGAFAPLLQTALGQIIGRGSAANVSRIVHSNTLILLFRLKLFIVCFSLFPRPLNPLGSRPEIMQTVVWIQTHLEEDADISLPKHEVYEEYM